VLAHALKNALARAWRASAGLGGHVLMHAAADRDLIELRRGLAEADHVAEALFERGEDLAPQPPTLDVQALLLKIEPSLQLAVTPAIRLTVRDADGASLVSADVGTLETVIRRLVDGAARLMQGGGELVLSVGWLDCLAGSWPTAPRAPYRFVRLTLTGNGREPETRAWWRVLEPPPGVPRGATESIAAMVGRLDGCVLIEGAAGDGHRLHVCLPAAFAR
jgi:hypothetical protein